MSILLAALTNMQRLQVFRGVHWSDDVFNHENVGFWHYLQPAYNVMGFISCAGTNFVIRSSAFAEAGMRTPSTPSDTNSSALEQRLTIILEAFKLPCGSMLARLVCMWGGAKRGGGGGGSG